MSISPSCFPDGLVYAVAEKDGLSRVPPRERMTPSASPEPTPPDERQRVDALLVQRVASGDREAFTELYQRFSGPLYGAALRILRDSAEAQDIVHDVFVTLWQKADTFNSARGSAFTGHGEHGRPG